jgi:hypothetical protein
MKRSFLFPLVLAAIVATSIGVISATAGTSSKAAEAAPPAAPQATNGSPSADLRVTLDRLLGEHAVLAQNATNSGVTGSKSFPATAKSLDRNSVELSKAIASLYGKNAGDVFLNGKFQWRDHIQFFVDSTVALAKKRQGRPGESGCKPDAVHEGARRISRQGNRAAEAGRPERPARSRARAEEPARRVCEGGLREVHGPLPPVLQPYVRDGRPACRRDREAEEPALDGHPNSAAGGRLGRGALPVFGRMRFRPAFATVALQPARSSSRRSLDPAATLLC